MNAHGKNRPTRSAKYIEDTEVLINKFRAKKNKAAFAQSLISWKNSTTSRWMPLTRQVRIRFPPAPRSGKVSIEAKA